MKDKERPDIPEVTKAWVAGFFDGEGCIMAYKWQRNSAYKLRHPKSRFTSQPYYVVRMTISQKDPYVLEEIYDLFGGWISSPFRYTLRSWMVCNRTDIAFFLTTILPYLRVKKRQAELALELCARMKRNYTGSRGLSDEERAARDVIVAEIKRLKMPNPGEMKRRKEKKTTFLLEGEPLTVYRPSEDVPSGRP